MAIDKKVKNNILEDWLNTFTQLSMFSKDKLYKIVGCCIIGIELIKSPYSEEYSPYFVVYPLWREDLKNCLNAPILMRRLKNKKGLKLDVPYANHHVYFDDAIECFKSQIPLSLNGDIFLKSLNEFAEPLFNEMLVKTNSAEQAKLFELIYYTTLYVGSTAQVQNVLSKIQQASVSWNMQLFEIKYGKFDLWFQELHEKKNNRSAFLIQIEINRQEKKISQLYRSELIV